MSVFQLTETAYRDDAAEVISRDLDLTDAEEMWTEEDKVELNRSLDLARAQIAWGEVISGRELREDYERRRALRAAKADGKGLMHYLHNAPDVPE